MKQIAIFSLLYSSLLISINAYPQSSLSPQPAPTAAQGFPKIDLDKFWCHNLLNRGPDSELDSDVPGSKPFPRPTPLPDLHLVRGGKVVVFNNDNSITVIREDGATSVGAANKCEKSDMTLGKYTASRFVELTNYVKAESRMPDEVKAKMNKWLIRYFDHCSKVYPDVEALRPMLADIRVGADGGTKKPAAAPGIAR